MRALQVGVICAFLVGTPTYATTLNLNDFVLFAGTGPISIGGGTQINSGAVGTNGNITTGTNVHVNSLDAGGNISPVGGGSTVSNGSNVIAGGNLTTGTNVHLDGVDVTLGGTNSFGGGTTAPASLSTNVAPAPFHAGSSYQLPTLPADGIAAPSSQAGGAVIAGTNQTTNRSPNQYGILNLGGGGTLNLTAGDYHFTSFTVGTNFNINYDLTGGPINIYVDGDASLGGNTHWNLTNGDASDVYWELNGDFTVGTNSQIYGTVFTANGGVANLGDNQNLNGGGLFVGQFLATGGITIGTNTEFSLLLNDRFTSADNVIGATPIPATLPLFGTGLGIIGLLGWRRKRKAAARAA
jgi:fibronectin-binding autotransporter adhesin